MIGPSSLSQPVEVANETGRHAGVYRKALACGTHMSSIRNRAPWMVACWTRLRDRGGKAACCELMA